MRRNGTSLLIEWNLLPISLIKISANGFSNFLLLNRKILLIKFVELVVFKFLLIHLLKTVTKWLSRNWKLLIELVEFVYKSVEITNWYSLKTFTKRISKNLSELNK